MKYLLFFSLLFFGCNSSKQPEAENLEDFSTIDSLIIQSNKNLHSLDSTSKKTDSAISGKVDRTLKQITNLEKENQNLKKENESLKIIIDESVDMGKPFELLPVSNGKGNR